VREAAIVARMAFDPAQLAGSMSCGSEKKKVQANGR
jgi:hypothetical protein